MSDLNEQLPAISSLDDLRTRARRLKEQGMDSLAGIRDNAFAAAEPSGDAPAPAPEGPAAVWQGSGGLIEAALLVRVQNKRDPGSAPEGLVARVLGVRLVEDLLSREATHIPVLLAARAMQTLIASPQHTLSRTTLLCYYRIIRELYVADSPDWNAGGAKAGAAGEVSAYVTAECVRAVMMLARSIKKTADFFRRTGEFCAHMERLASPQIPREWKEVECERAALEWYVSVAHGAAHLSLSLPVPELNPATQRFDHAGVQAYFTRLGNELVRGFSASADAFREALDEIGLARGVEAGREPPAAISRSESAHLLARQVIQDAWQNAVDSSDLCSQPSDALAHLPELAQKFARIAQEVRRLLDPAKRYVASVLDHELTAASQERPLWDARELAFAAGAYGALTDWRSDERLVRAARLLISVPSEDGLFPRGRPFHSMPNGLRWHTLQFEVCRAVCELLQHVDVPVSPQVTEQLLMPFEHLRPEMAGADGKPVQGWHMEDPPVPRRPTMWASALAVLALDKFVRMLDRKINKMVLAHFSRKKPEEMDLKLEKLLYADHGRRFIAEPPGGGDADEETVSREPVGITLQRMRAHILGAQLPGTRYTTVFSGVFFGPPGTGKTTLLEALAASSDVPLVEISPSDIAKSGEAALEAHARATFRALSMLTKVVIIFDEFEPVLWKRDSDRGPRQRDIYTFLTPGMLPKLAQLYSAAKRKRVVYGLMTNHLKDLDPAAIRRGRFDHHVGIYTPDPVSRAGRLMLELHRTLQSDGRGSGKVALNRAQLDRFYEVIQSSGGVAPVRLASKWLDPKATPDMPGGKPYVLSGGRGKPSRATLAEPGESAIDEERRLHTWERHVQVTTRLKELLDRPERVIAVGRSP